MMQPQQQQQQTVIATVQPQQPHVVRTEQTHGQFNAKQAAVIGILLIIFGCLSILFNAVDLAVGTGMWRYFKSSSGRIGSSIFDDTLSHASLGVAGHGFWCGVMVSYMRVKSGFHSTQRTRRRQRYERNARIDTASIFAFWSLRRMRQLCPLLLLLFVECVGGAENAGVENVAVENVAPERTGGKLAMRH